MTTSRFLRGTIGRGVLCLLLVCFMSAVCSGYSVLTHEQIVDLLWTDHLKPLLKQKYPKASEEDLRMAHAYAYGGSVIQDLGYYPFGNQFFSDLVHYVRSGDFVVAQLTEAANIEEYAFALGALSHYAADITGHPYVNAAVAQEYPKLRAQFGPSVTYAQGKKAHIRTEFGFDVVQVANNRYASNAYHDFIGFKVSKPLMERAFLKTYGIELKDVFFNLDLAIGSYRRAVSSVIPEMTKVALLLEKDVHVKEQPTADKQLFLYNLTRSEYEREWGNTYKKPGIRTKILAGLFKIVPKIGPLKGLKFQKPSPETEAMYLKSVNLTVEQYRAYLQSLAKGTLTLPNKDFDTGKLTHAGEYPSTDATYAKLLDKLVDNKFEQVSNALRQNILDFYKNPNAVDSTERKDKEWKKTLVNIQQLKSTSTAAAPTTGK